jgi:hypothetical protein
MPRPCNHGELGRAATGDRAWQIGSFRDGQRGIPVPAGLDPRSLNYGSACPGEGIVVGGRPPGAPETGCLCVFFRIGHSPGGEVGSECGCLRSPSEKRSKGANLVIPFPSPQDMQDACSSSASQLNAVASSCCLGRRFAFPWFPPIHPGPVPQTWTHPASSMRQGGATASSFPGCADMGTPAFRASFQHASRPGPPLGPTRPHGAGNTAARDSAFRERSPGPPIRSAETTHCTVQPPLAGTAGALGSWLLTCPL